MGDKGKTEQLGQTEQLATLLPRLPAPTSEEAHEDKPKSALRRRDRRAATCSLVNNDKGQKTEHPSSHEKGSEGSRRKRRTQTVTFGQRETLEFVPRWAGPDGKAL